jgi:hypothetical protein
MALHSADFSISGVNTAGTVLLNLKASAAVPITLVEFGVYYSVLSTTPYDIGLARMSAVGTGAITSTAGVPHVAGATSTAVLETAWATTRPSIAGSRFRRAVIPLTLGAGYTWPFPLGEGPLAAVAGGICFYGIGASGGTPGTLSGYATWDE